MAGSRPPRERPMESGGGWHAARVGDQPDPCQCFPPLRRRPLGVGSHLGLRILNFASKKPSNVRISTKNILTFDGLASPLELRAELSRIGVRTLFAPVGSSHPEQR